MYFLWKIEGERSSILKNLFLWNFGEDLLLRIIKFVIFREDLISRIAHFEIFCVDLISRISVLSTDTFSFNEVILSSSNQIPFLDICFSIILTSEDVLQLNGDNLSEILGCLEMFGL